MDLTNRRTRRWLYGCGLVTVLLSLRLWIYWYYPLLGHDHGALLPAMYEMHDAFARFGRIDLDFSPFRCLGLPVFSHPNGLVWSLFHVASLLFTELGALFAASAVFMVFGYVGSLSLVRGLGFRADVAALMAVGWCLQGFCVSHTLAGHLNFLQFAVLPLFLWIVIHESPSWSALGLVSFWMAHFVYTSGYYLLLTGVPSVLLAAFFLEWSMRERLQSRGLGGGRTAARNLLLAGAIAFCMCAPKALGVLNFTALFPRLIDLQRIDVWRALLYTLSQYVYPFPYDAGRLTGWSYGNWESYQFILPGMVYGLVYLLWRHRRQLPSARIVSLFAVLVVTGALLSSGVLRPVFEVLPLFRSLHVNPRWNAIVLLPFFVLALSVLGPLQPRDLPRSEWLLAVLWAIFFVVPLLFIDKSNMVITYTDRLGIDFARHRLAFCYEPLFGARLEKFPLGPLVDWRNSPFVDPRCYLQSSHCRPGTILGGAGGNPADDEALARYALRDEYPPVKYFKWISLLVYFAGFGCALAWIAQAARALLRGDE